MGARGPDAPSVPSIIFRMRYFPSLSFRSLVYSFRGRNVLRGEDFVTPRPGRVYSTTTVGAYKSSKCHIVVFWRLKKEMKVYGTRDVVLEQGHNCHLAKRRWKLLSVEMGHNTNSISYN